jgi:hypothetical protein
MLGHGVAVLLYGGYVEVMGLGQKFYGVLISL